MKRSTVLILLILTFLLSSCSQYANLPQVTSEATPGSANEDVLTPAVTDESADSMAEDPGPRITGRVVDMDGNPVIAATIASATDSTLSMNDGSFSLSSSGQPQWVTVSHSNFISRTRAAAPGIPVLIRLSPDDGKTISISFSGDVMFGRRFFDPNEDGNTLDGQLPTVPNAEDHLKLLAPIQPLLESSNITVINLESAIDGNPYVPPGELRPINYHPTKDYVYATHPSAITALQQAGVDVVDLGNNSVYDLLDPGVTNTISALDDAGIAHFGAGLNETEAWTPVVVPVNGQKIAFVGCTTIYRGSGIAKRKEITYVALDVQHKGGAALCDAAKLPAMVSRAKELADIVVVMIHGGSAYDRGQTTKQIRFTEIAKRAGATLVINHHPHVVSGFKWDGQALVAWSLGNFISDQTIWPTFESYMLTVYIRDGKVIRSFVEPVMLKDYVAHGLVGEMADYVVRGASGRSAGPFVLESGAMEMDLDNRAIQRSESVSLDGGTGTIVSIPQGQWLSDFKGTGALVLGRDVLWVGGFENEVVENDPATPPLWQLNQSSIVGVGPDFAYESQVGIRLSRGSSNQSDAVTTNLHRIPVSPKSHLTISGMVRGSEGAAVWLQASWYSDTVGPSASRTLEPIAIQANNAWQAFQLDVQTPPEVVAVGLFLRLSPPATGISTADFDNLRVIEWAPENTMFSPLYNFAYLKGAGELTFTQTVLPGGEDWLSTFP